MTIRRAAGRGFPNFFFWKSPNRTNKKIREYRGLVDLSPISSVHSCVLHGDIWWYMHSRPRTHTHVYMYVCVYFYVPTYLRNQCNHWCKRAANVDHYSGGRSCKFRPDGKVWRRRPAAEVLEWIWPNVSVYVSLFILSKSLSHHCLCLSLVSVYVSLSLASMSLCR